MVKSTLDIMLNGNEPVVQDIIMECGPDVANKFITKFNNACLQLAALEQDIQIAINQSDKNFLCPLENFSSLEH